jgi:type VI secretion system secreted protein Hcp
MKKIILSSLISFFLLSGLKSFTQVFVSFDGIKGESVFRAFPGSTEITSFEWGAKNQVSMSGAGGAGAGKVQVSELTITKPRGSASSSLQMSVFTGKHIPKAEIRFYKPGVQAPYLTITLEDVFITGWSISATGSDRATESISLVFTKFKTEDGIQKADGTIEKSPAVGWDIKKNTAN